MDGDPLGRFFGHLEPQPTDPTPGDAPPVEGSAPPPPGPSAPPTAGHGDAGPPPTDPPTPPPPPASFQPVAAGGAYEPMAGSGGGFGAGGPGVGGGAPSPPGGNQPSARDRIILVVGIVVVVALFVGGIIWRLGTSEPPPEFTAGDLDLEFDGDGGAVRPADADKPPSFDLSTVDPAPTPEPPPEGFTPEELNTHFGDAVWRVESDGCGFESGGSAFAITPNHLVTNEHVAVIDTRPQLVSRHGEVRTGSVVGMVEDPDLAIIAVEEPMDIWLDWVPATELVEGQQIVAMGYPLPAADFTVTTLGIASFAREGEKRIGIRGDGRIDRGNSGGPSLTTDGRVAGINTAVNINPGGQGAGLFGGGLQVVPFIFTFDAVEPYLADLVASDEVVEPNCARVDLSEARTYGDNPFLDSLWEECDAGNPWGCDTLYRRSRARTEYEAFGASCGNRIAGGGSCVNRFRGQWLQPNPGSYLDEFSDPENLPDWVEEALEEFEEQFGQDSGR
ncbi:MAG: trypsin-like peptidase domain-containing protein [Acidimicrobiia bacterium]|nr:trypsin-like peptidase domain-containing protein [Acidimicrobiia bacterium]